LIVQNVTVIVTAVVNQMVKDLQSLYALGFRNFVLSEMEPLDCLPSATAATGYTACVTPLTSIPKTHNLYLTAKIATTFPSSTGANVLFLDTEAAFYYILNNPLASGKRSTHRQGCKSESIISVKADNFIVSLCHWQLRAWLRLITLTRSPKPDSTLSVHHNREKYMSYNNLKRICGNLKAIKQLN
jgi:hypothetical protein